MENWTAHPVAADYGLPWKRWFIADAKGHAIATIDPTGKKPADIEKKARLMASAPELLAALKRIETWLTNEQVGAGEFQSLDQLAKYEMLHGVRAAIAKAIADPAVLLAKRGEALRWKSGLKSAILCVVKPVSGRPDVAGGAALA